MNVEIYTTATCPFCNHAKQLLQHNGMAYSEIPVGGEADRILEMIHRSGRRTVPQIFIDGRPIGGYDQLKRLLDDSEAA